MNEKKEERQMAVACPLCLKKGKQSKVKLFQINYSEALVSCENSQCPFPLLEGHLTTTIVRREYGNMEDKVTVKDPASDTSTNGSENSSQSEPACIEDEDDESEIVSYPNVSDTTHTTAVLNTSASNSKVMGVKFEKFDFTAPIPLQSEAKRKPKKKYYTGSRKRKNYKKPIPKTQNVGIEPEA